MASILITGASRGIGFELTRQYVKAGERVFACVRTPEKADALTALAKASGGRLSIHAMDVGNTASIKAAGEAIGQVPIDILINNAGIYGGPHQALGDLDEPAWHDAFQTMTIGPVRVLESFLPQLKKAKTPKVMTVTSQVAASSWPTGGFYIYGSAKAALNRVMKSIAEDLKPDNVTVALVHPGWVKTDMGGENAEISVEDSASGIRRVIDRLTPAETGQFFKWNGAPHPW